VLIDIKAETVGANTSTASAQTVNPCPGLVDGMRFDHWCASAFLGALDTGTTRGGPGSGTSRTSLARGGEGHGPSQ